MTKGREFLGASQGRLLAADEPAPVELENEAGPAPFFLICDHATAFIPAALNKLGLDEAELARHIALDIGAAAVTRLLARQLEARALLSHFSRLVIDPNRWPEDPTLIPQISDGTVVPGNRDLGAEGVEVRKAAFYRPYHAAIEAEFEQRLARGETPALISMHSFTPVMRGAERPWQVGILWREDGRIAEPLIERLRRRGLVVGDNEPYSAREGLGHTVEVHAEPRGLPCVLIEVRQDLIDTRQGAVEWAAILAEELRPVLDGLTCRRGHPERGLERDQERDQERETSP